MDAVYLVKFKLPHNVIMQRILCTSDAGTLANNYTDNQNGKQISADFNCRSDIQLCSNLHFSTYFNNFKANYIINFEYQYTFCNNANSHTKLFSQTSSPIIRATLLHSTKDTTYNRDCQKIPHHIPINSNRQRCTIPRVYQVAHPACIHSKHRVSCWRVRAIIPIT